MTNTDSLKQPMLWHVIVAGLLLLTILFVLTSGCIGRVVFDSDGSNFTARQNISSLDREMSMSGSFSLGSGYISGDPSYYMNYELPDGSYKLVGVPAKDSRVYYDEPDFPYIEATYHGHSSHCADIPIVGVNEFFTTDSYGCERQGDAKIHIPPSSKIVRFEP